MAHVDLYRQTDMAKPTSWFGKVSSYSESEISLSGRIYSATYSGSFSFSRAGLVGGTVTGYQQWYDGISDYQVTDISVSVITLNGYMKKGDVGALYRFVLSGDDVITGSSDDDIIKGFKGNDDLSGGLGNDSLYGDIGADILFGSDGNDLLDGGGEADSLDGSVGDDTLLGGTGDDSLSGGDGKDLLNGGSGADTMVGGAGNDTYLVDDPGDVVIETAAIDQANGVSQNVHLSADGRYVVFESLADNLVAGDTNEVLDIFVYDVQAGERRIVSTSADGSQGNEVSQRASISADGRYVVFVSNASNLVAGDSNGAPDIFRKDLQTGAIQRVSTNADGSQTHGASGFHASISVDGRYVVFENAGDLTANPNHIGVGGLFLKDMQTGEIQLVSTAADGSTGNGMSENASVSADGRYVAFNSYASNLVAGDTNATSDVFLKDMQTGAIQLVSAVAGGSQSDNFSGFGTVSADGRSVLFSSSGTNLIPADSGANNGFLKYDLYLKDIQSGALQRISSAADGSAGNASTMDGIFSANGRYVLFSSYASNLGGGGGGLFRKDLQTGGMERISTQDDGSLGQSIGGSGAGERYVVFQSGQDIFLKDLQTGELRLTSAGIGMDHVKSSISYTLTDNVEMLTLMGNGAINATGNALSNALTGNRAANVLDGKAGADAMAGGLGNDIYIVDDANDSIIEAARAGTDLVKIDIAVAGGHYTLAANVENALLINTVAFNLTGNGQANTLTGNAEANLLDGGVGIDKLIGGAGDDTYVVDLSAAGKLQDGIVEATDGGTDTLQLRGSSKNAVATTLTLAKFLENLDASATANSKLNLIGNAADNTLSGNAANNLLKGLAGNDTLAGGDGNDILVGGAGNDSLTGGNGTDSFRIETALDDTILSVANNIDTVEDFQAGSDRIELENAIFTRFKSLGALNAGNFVAGNQIQALDNDDFILYDTETGALYYDADGNGVHTAVQFATLVGVGTAIGANDFFII